MTRLFKIRMILPHPGPLPPGEGEWSPEGLLRFMERIILVHTLTNL
jgi:hypothetical protein